MSDRPDDPNWPRASAWLAGDHRADPTARLAVLGVPLHAASITPGRCDLAPAAIRGALGRLSTYDRDTDVDVRSVLARDQGNLAVADARPEEALDEVAGAVGGTLDTFEAIALLGGDNSVTRPGCRGLGPGLDRVGLLTLDAHLDLRDTAGGLTNGNPVRALLEDGLPGWNVVQVGLQPFANSREYTRVAERAGLRGVTASEARARGLSRVVGDALDHLERRVDRIYVDVDVDVLDRASAPACPGARPGGLLPWEIQGAVRICGRHPKVRALDIVEVDPTRDVADVTVLAAASFLLAFAAGVATRVRLG
ncbi:MAG: arginase family protein [Actinomycetota bacterium]